MAHPIASLTREQAHDVYLSVMHDKDSKAMRDLCINDLFFLLCYGCKRPDIDRQWLFERCREVEANPNGCLDLWAREHYKSTIITFGLSIKDILTDPDTTIGIFSHTRPVAKAFLKQIKDEFEANTFLKALFPDILYAEPRKESSSWSLDGGLMVKRPGNSKENTVEAWGLVDGQPTSKHFRVLNYDDIVTLESVTTPEQMKKTTEAFSISLNLGAEGGARRLIGTRYHFADSYREIMSRGTVQVRQHPATDTGTMEGNPVLLSRESLLAKRRDMGPYVFGCQMLLDPKADGVMGFQNSWLRFFEHEPPKLLNKYIIVDPASKRKKTSDYTTMWVVGLGVDQNYYIVDGVHDRLSLTQRADNLFRLVREHRLSGFQRVGYEEYGLQADIEHMQDRQARENYRFEIIPLGGQCPKEDRIRKLVPLFENGRIIIPRRMLRADTEGKVHDLVQEFIADEYEAFPVALHDDMLDDLARIIEPDLGAAFPMPAASAAVATQTENKKPARR